MRSESLAKVLSVWVFVYELSGSNPMASLRNESDNESFFFHGKMSSILNLTKF